jgi:hypothetical protein
VGLVGRYPARRSALYHLDVDHHPRVLVLKDVAVEEIKLLALLTVGAR